MKDIQEECQRTEYTATSGGVTVTVNGSNEVISSQLMIHVWMTKNY